MKEFFLWSRAVNVGRCDYKLVRKSSISFHFLSHYDLNKGHCLWTSYLLVTADFSWEESISDRVFKQIPYLINWQSRYNHWNCSSNLILPCIVCWVILIHYRNKWVKINNFLWNEQVHQKLLFPILLPSFKLSCYVGFKSIHELPYHY